MNNHIPFLGALAVLTTPLAAQNAGIVHFWDFENGSYEDKVGTAHGTVTAGKEDPERDPGTPEPDDDLNTFPGSGPVPGTGHGGTGSGVVFGTYMTPVDDEEFNHVAIDSNGLYQPGAKPFSLTFWIKADPEVESYTGARGIMDFSGDPSDGSGELADGFQTLFNRTTGDFVFRIDSSQDGVALALMNPHPFDDRQWHFVAVTYDPLGDLEVHVDGYGVDASAAGLGQDEIPFHPQSYFGAFNLKRTSSATNGNNDKNGLGGTLDDVAIYHSLLSEAEITGLYAGTLAPTDIDAPLPGPSPVGHYWDIDTFDSESGIPIDRGNGLFTDENGLLQYDSNLYGEAYPGAGDAMNVKIGGSDYLVAETYEGTFPGGQATGLDFGTGSFAISYMAYDDSIDGDPRGLMAMDCLNGTETGFQISTDPAGVFIFRLDDDAGNSITSISQAGTVFETLKMPADQWVCVVINVNRDADEVEIFFDGASQGTYDISSISGNIACSQDLQIGVINGGGTVTQAQEGGLDDIAIYPGVLSAQQVADLSAHTVSPLDLLATFQPDPGLGIPVVSVDYDSGTNAFTVVFTSQDGPTYSVYGGTSLQDSAAWPELSTTDLVGDGTNLTFTHAPAGSPSGFYFEIRED